MNTWVVVVETENGKKSTTVGPYHSREKADKDRAAWDGGAISHDRIAFVEPVLKPEEYAKQFKEASK